MPSHQLFDKLDDGLDPAPEASIPHDRVIYHCLGCGRVVHQEAPAGPPACCGQMMQRSAVETIGRDEGGGEPRPNPVH